MKKIAWQKSIHCVCKVRTAVALLLVVTSLALNDLPAQAQLSKARAGTVHAHTRKAGMRAQKSYNQKLRRMLADNTIADSRTRALVRHIHADQIASIQFIDLLRGPIAISMPTKDPNQVAVHPYFAPIVTDRRLIAHFLRALRHAYKLKGAIPAMDTPSLEITFRKSGHFQREPLDIDINFDYFGSEFQSVLNEVPGYLAAQLHRKMQTLDGQVRGVNFATFRVTDPEKIAQITHALQQVKPIAFSVYGSTFDTFGLSLRLRQGGLVYVTFVLEHSDVSRVGSAILPEPLWNYYKLVGRGKGVVLNTDAHKKSQSASVLGTTRA